MHIIKNVFVTILLISTCYFQEASPMKKFIWHEENLIWHPEEGKQSSGQTVLKEEETNAMTIYDFQEPTQNNNSSNDQSLKFSLSTIKPDLNSILFYCEEVAKKAMIEIPVTSALAIAMHHYTYLINFINAWKKNNKISFSRRAKNQIGEKIKELSADIKKLCQEITENNQLQNYVSKIGNLIKFVNAEILKNETEFILSQENPLQFQPVTNNLLLIENDLDNYINFFEARRDEVRNRQQLTMLSEIKNKIDNIRTWLEKNAALIEKNNTSHNKKVVLIGLMNYIEDVIG